MMTELLQNRTWRDLRVTARAYCLRFNNNFTKAEAAEYVSRSLLDEGGLRRALHKLSADERAALMALKAQGGVLLRWRFCQAYGQIERYRPWRADAPPNPWRQPISLAQKLWYLGLIEVDAHRSILLPEAVARLLPPVPQPRTAVWSGEQPALEPAASVRDLAVFLGTLLRAPVRPLHGRWLPPYTLKAINQRLSQPRDLTGIRSEFQCPRLHFLHYLARAAGLVSLQAGVLLPTAEAWRWLALPYIQAHQRLVDAVSADLQARASWWERFRLPPIDPIIWNTLIALPPRTYSLASLSKVLQLQTLRLDTRTQLHVLLTGPLRWLGLGTARKTAVMIGVRDFPEPAAARLQPGPDAIAITLGAAPPLHPLAELMACASSDDDGLRIDSASLARALEAGRDQQQLAQMLAALSGAPLPASIMNCLNDWEHEARRARIRHAAILEIADAADMRAIRSDWRLRPLLGEQLSLHRVVVRDERRLRQRLQRRGFALPQLQDHRADALPRANDDDPAYLWLAGRTCQALAAILPLPIPIPGAAFHGLEASLGERVDALQGIVDQYVDQVRAALRGRVQNRPVIAQADPAQVRNAVEQAVTRTSPLRIRYFSPAAGYETERTIEPELIYERNGATYVEAWCNLDAAQRTFRLDRILAVV